MQPFRFILLPLLLLSVTAHLACAAEPAVYTDAIDQYLAGDWDALESTFSKRPGEITALSKEQAADIAYIKRALAECHPAWWAQTKSGKKVIIHPTVWAHTINAIYDPSIKGNLQLQSTNGQITLSVNWLATDMDNPAPAEHGFSKGDLASLGNWGILGTGEVWLQPLADRGVGLAGAQRTQYQRYQEFRGCVTGIYYGTPRARRWGCFLSLDAFGNRYLAAPAFIPRKPVGAMIMAEVAKDPERYPSLRVPHQIADENVEQRLAASLMNQFSRPLSFAEDKALRESVRALAVANTATVFTTGKVALANKLTVMIDPDQDTETAKLRNTWLKDHLNPAATQPKPPEATP